jgi:hypothetical protein
MGHIVDHDEDVDVARAVGLARGAAAEERDRLDERAELLARLRGEALRDSEIVCLGLAWLMVLTLGARELLTLPRRYAALTSLTGPDGCGI